MRAGVLFVLFWGACASAQEFDLDCYGGPVSHPELRELSEARFAVGKGEASGSSFLVLYFSGRKASEDVGCAAAPKNTCRLHDDGGQLKILSIGKERMVIEFTGKPVARFNGDETGIGIDPKAGLKTPLRVTLRARAARDCTY